MRKALTIGLMAVLGGQAVEAQEPVDDSPLEARIWLDRGDQPVLQRGDRVSVYYRTSVDAHTAIFRIDTDGRVTLVHPAHPGATEPTRGARDYRLLFPESARWVVSEYPGIGYYFIVATEQPLDFSRFDFVRDEDRWDLVRVGETVYEDPYVAIDAYVAALIPDWEVAPYALDFIEYSVGEAHSFPRFLCYDCHGERPYTSWNPYTYACTDFRVVLWDDPYYYPAYRYAGTRAVFPRPLRNRPRYTVAVRLPGEGWSPRVRTRPAPPIPRRVTQYKELGVATTPRSATPVRRPQAQAPSAAPRSAVPRRSTAATPPSSTSRPGVSSRRPVQSSNARPSAGRSTTSRSATPSRPTLQRRPSSSTALGMTSGRTSTSRPSSRTNTTRAPAAASGSRTRVAKPSGLRSPTRARPRASQPRRGSATRSSPPRSAPVTRSARATRNAPVTRSVPTTRSAPVTRSVPTTRSAPVTRSRPTVSRARPSTTRAKPRTTGARAATSRPATRSAPARRPTVKARPKPPPRRGGRGG